MGERCDVQEIPVGMEPLTDIETTWSEVYDSFDKMNLRPELLNGMCDLGFEKPLDIQQRAIIACVRGNDLIAEGPPGTGKTSALLIGILQQIDTTVHECQALILTPTRELATFKQHDIMELGKHMKVHCHACIGGTNLREEVRTLQAGCHVVVGTPGRVIDMMKRKAIPTETIKLFVLDEADTMSCNFKDQVEYVFKMLPNDLQVLFVSVTMSPNVLKALKCFMRKTVCILFKSGNINLEDYTIFNCNVKQTNLKIGILHDLLGALPDRQCIVFCKSHRNADKIAKEIMEKHNFSVSTIHGAIKQCDRELIINQFHSGSSRVLVATDIVSTRAIPMEKVPVIINYDLTTNITNYLKRICCSSRLDRKAVVINFINDDSESCLKYIETYYHRKIEEMPPNIADII